MNHDRPCVNNAADHDSNGLPATTVPCCRCEVRALEARLAEAEQERDLNHRKYIAAVQGTTRCVALEQDLKACEEKAVVTLRAFIEQWRFREKAEALLAEWRPVVAHTLKWAEVECHVPPKPWTAARDAYDLVAALSDAAREAAR